MGIFSIVKQQKKKWSKYSNHSSESLSESGSEESVRNIELPHGVILKSSPKAMAAAAAGKKRRRKHHHFFPKFFSSIFKSKYNEAIAVTQAKTNGGHDCDRENDNPKDCSLAQGGLKKKHLERFDTNETFVQLNQNTASSAVHFGRSYVMTREETENKAEEEEVVNEEFDSEKTVQRNNIQYLPYLKKRPEKEEKERSSSSAKAKHGQDHAKENDNCGSSDEEEEDSTTSDYESTLSTVVADPWTRDLTWSRNPVILSQRQQETLPVLDEYLAELIRTRLPNLLQEAITWNLLFSLDQHGASLSTLYENIRESGPCIMILKNSENEIFGAFISEPFDTLNRGFFGSPQCFLWKVNEFEFRKYEATNKNQYFMLADPTFIAMGGGNGNFGFYLDDDIQFGYSSKCDTYNNDILTENNEFECYGLEIWNFEY